MSDLGRKDLSAGVEQKATPDCCKSTVDKVGDTTTGKTDKVARDAIPDSAKSTTQSVADKTSRVDDQASHVEGKGHGFRAHVKDELSPKHLECAIKHPVDEVEHIIHHHKH